MYKTNRDDWWGDTDSSSDSSYGSTRSEKSEHPVWANHVSSCGDLFYVVKKPKVPTAEPDPIKASPAKPPSGILVKLIRRRSSLRNFRKTEGDDSRDPSPPKQRGGEFYQLKVELAPTLDLRRTNRVDYNLNQLESRLGLIVDKGSTSSSGGNTGQNKTRRLIILGVKPDFDYLYRGAITPGDILWSIDNHLVTTDNVDSLLIANNNKEVLLKLRSCKSRRGSSVHKDVSFGSNWPNVNPEDGMFLKGGDYNDDGGRGGDMLLKETDQDDDDDDKDEFLLLYSRPGDLKEGTPLDQAIIYRYPQNNNYGSQLTKSAGAFYTLIHLIPSFFNSTTPNSSTICYKGKLLNIIYTTEGKDVLLLGLPQKRVSLNEAIVLNQNLVKCLKFSFQSLSRCFTNSSNRGPVDIIVSNFFKRIFDIKLPFDPVRSSWMFETCQPTSLVLPIPKDIQVQLGDAMNELESNDIKEFDSHRLYSVIGSCFFHKGYLMRWQLLKDDLIELVIHLKLIGLMDLTQKEGVDEIIYWKEVYPLSGLRGSSNNNNNNGGGGQQHPPQPYTTMTGQQARWFLMAIGQDNDLLVVLLESGGCTARMEGNPGPNGIYIDEAQATLEHIQTLGIPKFISKWLEVHCSMSSVGGGDVDDGGNKSGGGSPQQQHNNNNLINDYSSKNSNTNNGGSVKILDSPLTTKHRNSIDFTSSLNWDVNNVKMKSVSLPNVSGCPVMGRRAERERASETNSQSKISESDISEESDTRDGRSGDSNSLFDLNEFGKNLPVDCNNLPLSRLGVGEGGGAAFHYVQLDTSEGIMVTNLMQQSMGDDQMEFIINSFRKYSHHIHLILANTVSFKKLKPQEVPTTILNRSLIAVKEHGILFNTFKGGVGGRNGNKKVNATYWVVGRLFFTPQLKEVYVCYEDSCPHNMIEIAFRIALNCYM